MLGRPALGRGLEAGGVEGCPEERVGRVVGRRPLDHHRLGGARETAAQGPSDRRILWKQPRIQLLHR